MHFRILTLLALLVATTANADVTVNGQLIKAQLEKLTADPTGSEARVYWDTDDNLFRVYNGASWLSVADLSRKLSAFAATSSAELQSVISDETGTGALYFAGGAAGTPASINLTNGTALPISGIASLGSGVGTWLATPSSANLATAITDETGSGALVFGTAPTITLGNGTGLPISTGVSGLGSGVATALATPSSANLATAITDETGSGALVFGTAPTITLANGTNLPVATGISGLGTGVATFLATPSSANLAAAITDETGSGAQCFATSPTLVTPVLGVATATTVNKVTLTAPATGSTLTVADGKVFTASNTMTLTGTDGSSVAVGTGGTVAYVANKLSVFAATTSAELFGVLSDETGGSGVVVGSTSPVITTPTVRTSLLLQNASGSQPELLMSEDPDNGTNKMTVKAAATMASDYILTLPATDGDAGQLLSDTDGSGTLGWVSPLTNPMDSAGDLIVGGVAGAATKLDSGTSGQFLASAGAASPVWTTLVPIANGGTNKALTLSAGGLPYFDSDSFEVLSAGTGSDWTLSGGAGAPTFSSTTTTAKTFSETTDASSSTTGTVIVSGGVGIAKKLYVGTSLNFSDNTQGITATATNDNAGSGFVGEFASITKTSGFNQASAGDGTYYDVTSLTLTLAAGDWDIDWYVPIEISITAGAVSGSVGYAALRSGSSTLEQGQATCYAAFAFGATCIGTGAGHKRVSISGSTTYKMSIAQFVNGGTPTVTVYALCAASSTCYIYARRAR